MYLKQQDITNLSADTLLGFLSQQIPEGHHLDYKIKFPEGSARANRIEILKDITAFANANGGNIIIGADEPKEGVSEQDQLVGIEKGDGIAHDLERVANSSIDPRIPGLLIVPVALSDGKFAIVIHVPPSISKPHMVQYENHRAFYIRHTESSDPMSTYEIRESVIASATAEHKVKVYMAEQEGNVRQYILGNNPAVLMQAMPLISPEQPIDVLSEESIRVVQGVGCKRDDYKRFEGNDLRCLSRPRPTIDGVMGVDSRSDPRWQIDAHRNGYVSAIIFANETTEVGNVSRHYLYKEHMKKLFPAFCLLCGEWLETVHFSSPYVMKCKYIGADGSVLLTGTTFERVSDPYEKGDLVWPDRVNPVGDDFMAIAEEWYGLLFNAYGYDQPATGISS